MKKTRRPRNALLVAVRRRRTECALVLVAACLFAGALRWRAEAIAERRTALRLALADLVASEMEDRSPSTDVASTLLSVMIAFSGGRWRVLPESVQSVATLGKACVETEHASRRSSLYPSVDLGWPVGGGHLRRNEPLWHTRSVFGMVRSEGTAGVEALITLASSGASWMPESGCGEVQLDRVFIPAGYSPEGYSGFGTSFSARVGGRNMLPLAIATTDPTFDATAIDAWKQQVRADIRALARRGQSEVDAPRDVRAEETAMSCALAALLGVTECADDLDVIRRLWEVPATTRSGATDPQATDVIEVDVEAIARSSRFALVGGDASWSGTLLMEHLAARFTPQREFVARIERDPSRPDDVRDAARQALIRLPAGSWAPSEPPSTPAPWVSWVLFSLLMVPLGMVAARRPHHDRPRHRLRRRDVIAFWMVGALASTNVPLWGPFTTATPGLVAFALVLLFLRRDPRTSLPTVIPASLLIAAASLPIADACTLAGLDAIARALCFVVVSRLALCGLEPLPPLAAGSPADSHSVRRVSAPQSAAPRRPIQSRGWPVVQIIAATLAISGLLVALLEPMGWAAKWPRTDRWLDALAIVAALTAGLVAFARKPGAWRQRPDPLVCVAIALGAAIHLTFIASSIVEQGTLPGGHELAFLTAGAAGTLLVFAFARVGLFVHRMRRMPA